MRLLRLENVVLALHDDADAAARKRLLHFVNMLALLHENRDVARFDRSKPDGLERARAALPVALPVVKLDARRADRRFVRTGLERCRPFASSPNEPRDVVGNGLRRSVDDGLLVLEPFLRAPYFQNVGLVPAFFFVKKVESRAVGLRLDCVVGEVAAQEGLFTRHREKGVHRLHELRTGTEVAPEAAVAADEAAGAHVRIKIGRSEAVDGLLRVAHKKERPGLARTALAFGNLEKELLEDGELNRVRILKFVDQDALVRVADAGRKGARDIVAQHDPHFGEQIVKGGEPSFALQRAKLGGRGPDEALEPGARAGFHVLVNDAGREILGHAREMPELARPVVAAHETAAFGRRRARVELAAQKGFRHLLAQCGIVVGELGLKASRRRKDVFAQHLLAEAVNRADGRIVKARERISKARNGLFVGDETAAPDVDLPDDERINVLAAVDPRQVAERLADVGPDAACKLRRGGLREGHDEQLVDRHVELDDQPEHQVLDRKGLAGAGRRLKKRGLRERRGLHRKVARIHRHDGGPIFVRAAGRIVGHIIRHKGAIERMNVLMPVKHLIGRDVKFECGQGVRLVERLKRRHIVVIGHRVFCHRLHPAFHHAMPARASSTAASKALTPASGAPSISPLRRPKRASRLAWASLRMRRRSRPRQRMRSADSSSSP